MQKKYMLEEERNTEIERDNRMLYHKIVGHFHTDMESFKKSQTRRTKWSKKKDKERVTKSNLSPNDRLQRLVRSKSKRSKVTLNEM